MNDPFPWYAVALLIGSFGLIAAPFVAAIIVITKQIWRE